MGLYLFIGLVTGAFGMGYFVYGKKTGKPVPMACGALLCFYMYFMPNIWLILLVGIILIILPFFIKIEW
jgi:hypothetical protein